MELTGNLVESECIEDVVDDMLTMCERMCVDTNSECIENVENDDDVLTMCDRMCVDTNYTRDVVITAFEGQFDEFNENPSSIILNELLKEDIENVKLHVHKIPASYESVVEKIPELRKNYPDEVIHLATHSVPNTIYFQDRAFSDGYCKEDVNGYIPHGNKIELLVDDDKENRGEDPKCIKPFVDFNYLIGEVIEKCELDGEKYGGLKVEKHEDPGRSVGGYLYYLSLREKPVNTLFIHIPPIEGECSKEAIASVIREAIKFITMNDF